MGANELLVRTLEFLRRRRVAYRLAFGTNHITTSVRAAYKRAFGHYAGQAVLIDLATFCRASETCFHEDPRKHAVLEGRREVFLRIQNHLRLNEKQLYAIYSGQQFPMIEEDDNAA